MKKVCVFSILLLAVMYVSAQPATKTKVTFKNSTDSFSYALGQSLAAYYKMQGVSSYNTALLVKAINDVLTAKGSFSDEEVNQILGAYLMKARDSRLTRNKKESEQFLVENSKKKGVTTTKSGLQYIVIKEGNGEKASLPDTVLVNYKGSLIDGTEFDNSLNHGGAVRFPVQGMIAGWTEVLQLMPKGSKWKVFVPSSLAYGEMGAGDKIGPNAALVFEIEVLQVFPHVPPKID